MINVYSSSCEKLSNQSQRQISFQIDYFLRCIENFTPVNKKIEYGWFEINSRDII